MIFYLHVTGGDRITALADTITIPCSCVGLVEVSGRLLSRRPKTNFERYYLCSDVCQDVFVMNKKLPILREIFVNSQGYVINNLHSVIWVKSRRDKLDKIRLFICNQFGEVLPFGGEGLYCTLLIKDTY